MKRFIFYRNDRLGDFIIITSIINKIKEVYKKSHITVVCSPKNYDLIKSYPIVDKIFIYDKRETFLKRLSIFFRIIKYKYYATFAIDGKSFSYICNFFTQSTYKLGLSYYFKYGPFRWSKPNFFYNHLIFDKFGKFTSKKDLKKIEHLPSKLIKLTTPLKLKLTPQDPYFYKVDKKNIDLFKSLTKRIIPKKYILIHFDEKWSDLKSIETDLSFAISSFQDKIKKKIIITSYNNKFQYYKNFKKKYLVFTFKNNKLRKSNKSENKKITILENCTLPLFERLINNSLYSISCHSGFLIQISGFNKTKLIDIINKRDKIWYSCWKPHNTFHKFVLKSTNYNKISLNKIFKKITDITKA